MQNPEQLRIEERELRRKALDRYADGLSKSIGAARGTLLVANLMALLLLGSLFNSLYSWNYSQQARRAQLLSAVNEAEHTLRCSSDGPEHNRTRECGGSRNGTRIIDELKELARTQPNLLWLQVTLGEYDKHLSYLPLLNSPDDIRAVTMQEMAAHIAREKEQDTLQFPFVSTKFTATDRTIIGGLALILAAAWLIGAIGRQKAIMNEFIEHTDNPDSINKNYLPDEHVYIQKSLSATSFVGARSGDLTVSFVGWALWSAPPGSVFLCAVYYIWVGGPLNITTSYRHLSEIVALLLVTIIWISAKQHDNETIRLLRTWEKGVRKIKGST